ncbi:MAG TPA: hypothetical protein VFL85_01370 [Candidatus Saccharimonadales bacterium]|nr:hypothetical protein [Candidatus Saccharimonadales bacterium]
MSHGDGFNLLVTDMPVTGCALFWFVTIVLAIDFIWALFFIIWLVKTRLHIHDKGSTLYLR